jgi:prepilin-type N-terminal cleavage/methylation domain-containing protein
MQNGFTLIELLIVSLIATVLLGILFFVFSQTNQLMPTLDSYDDVYTKASILNMQLERDYSGTFAPNEYYERQKKQEPEKKKEEEAQKKTTEEKTKKEEQQKKAGEEKKEAKPPLEKLFYGTSKDGSFDYLTFITNNPLIAYWGEKTGSARPRVVRIVYRLQEEKETEKGRRSYQLIRQESTNLEYKDFEKKGPEIKEYVIAQGIKDLSVEYTALIEPAKKEEGSAKKREARPFKDWTQKPSEKEDAEKIPLVPQIMEWKITFWDYKKKRTFPFIFKLYNRVEIPEKQKSQEAPSKLLKMIKEQVGKILPPSPTTPAQQSMQRPSYAPPRGLARV